MISDSKTLPQNQFTYFSEKVGVVSRLGPPSITNGPLPDGDVALFFKYSDNGTHMVVVDPARVRVYLCDTYAEKLVIPEAGVTHAYFSPLGSYLVTWQRPTKELSENNMKLWSVEQGILIAGWKLRHQLSWPTIQWSADELVTGALLQIGKVSFYAGANFSVPVQSITSPGLAMFSIAPGKSPYKVAVFIPEKGTTPGTVSIYTYPRVDKPAVSKTFFADSIDISWNTTGSAMLLTVNQDIDQTGKSYYGKKGLFYLQSNGNFDARVTGESIHDVKWNPNGMEFSVVYGDMPDPKISLFDTKCQKTADLAESGEARNTLYYDPKGRILCVGGFGSLSGNMDFWDLTGAQVRKIGSANSFSSAYHEWCPDSFHFLTGVVAPRMRVGNCIKIFNYNGELVYSEDIPELFEVRWRPQSVDIYPVLPISAPNPQARKVAPVTAPKPYRHPNFSGTSASVQAPKTTPTRYVPGGHGGGQRQIPGSVPVGGIPESDTSPGAGRGRGKKKPKNTQGQGRGSGIKKLENPEEKQEQGETPEQPGSLSEQPQTPEKEVDPEKRKKTIARKLRDIETLKQRQANGDNLNSAQLTKIGTEASLRVELGELETN